ncbi:hypothetical protein K2Y11_07765 [bacterium]|nr:hypothetical protein [bacterium]
MSGNRFIARESGSETTTPFESAFEAATKRIGLVNVSRWDRVEVAGNDRAKLIGNLCTNEIVKLPSGTGCEAFFLNAKGKIIDYGMIYSVGDSLWIDLEPSRGALMVKHLDRYIFREDVQLHDRSESHAQFHLAGPKGHELLSLLGLSGELPDRAVCIQEWEGAPIQVRRRARSTEGGIDLVIPAEHAAHLWSRLLESGKPLGLEVMDEDVLETLRVEASLPRFGMEVTEENLPQEIGRDKEAISFHKGCYIGQETVARLDAYGHVNKILRGFESESGAPMDAGQPLFKEGKQVGTIASAVDSPRWSKRIGMGVVRVAGVDVGSTVEAQTPDGPLAVKIIALPFETT